MMFVKQGVSSMEAHMQSFYNESTKRKSSTDAQQIAKKPKPHSMRGSSPSSDGRSSPSSDERSNPSIDERSSPIMDGRCSPSNDGRSSPIMDARFSPSNDGRSSPIMDARFSPSSDGRSIPIMDARFSPSSDRRSSPIMDGICSPSIDGRSSPIMDARFSPSSDGRSSPIMDARFSPSSDGRSSPIMDGRCNPSNDGLSSPMICGRPDSSSGGKPTASSVGGSAPGAIVNDFPLDSSVPFQVESSLSFDVKPSIRTNGMSSPSVDGGSDAGAIIDVKPSLSMDGGPITSVDERSSPMILERPGPSSSGRPTASSNRFSASGAILNIFPLDSSAPFQVEPSLSFNGRPSTTSGDRPIDDGSSDPTEDPAPSDLAAPLHEDSSLITMGYRVDQKQLCLTVTCSLCNRWLAPDPPLFCDCSVICVNCATVYTKCEKCCSQFEYIDKATFFFCRVAGSVNRPCRYKHVGCTYTLKPEDLHEPTCEFKPIPCEKCNEFVSKKLMQEHHEEQHFIWKRNEDLKITDFFLDDFGVRHLKCITRRYLIVLISFENDDGVGDFKKFQVCHLQTHSKVNVKVQFKKGVFTWQCTNGQPENEKNGWFFSYINVQRSAFNDWINGECILDLKVSERKKRQHKNTTEPENEFIHQIANE